MEQEGIHIFTNGKIFTADRANPYADSMVAENGTIAWVGQEADMPLPYRQGRTGDGAGADAGAGGDCLVTDLQGRRVIPGFVDAHMHPVMLADCQKQIAVMPPQICSIRDLMQEIRKRRQAQGPGRCILGWGYDEQGLLEKRPPDRHDLDRACSDAPVILTRTCVHIRSANSMALRLAGIDRNTPNPPGGEIERDETGEPTGILKENARHLLNPILPPETEADKVENLLGLGKILDAQGITSICDMGNMDGTDNFPIYEAAAGRGFSQRVGVYYMWDFFADRKDFHIPNEHFDRNRKIFAAGLKLIGDGSVSGRTAWMDRPYPGTDDEYGISVCSDRLLESAVAFCKENHCQLSMHAMGRRAISRMVERACREGPWTPAGIPYVRVEHVTDPSEESIEKAVQCGISFVSQPIFPYAESKSYLRNLGARWLNECYPFRHMLEKGINLGFSTDAPATFWSEPSDPFPGLKAAVTRTAADGTSFGKAEAVTPATALWLYTRGAALAAGLSDTGMLAKGFHADFAVLSDDILETAPEDIDKIRVLQTWADGRCIFQR